MLELNPGETYTVTLGVTNTSRKAGTQVAAILGIGISAAVADIYTLISPQIRQVSFTAGETKQVTFSMVVPADASGEGSISAWVETPAGEVLADATADIIVEELSTSVSGHVTAAVTGSPLPGVAVEILVNGVLAMTTTTNSSGRYLFDNVPFLSEILLKFSKAGYNDTSTVSFELAIKDSVIDVEMTTVVPTSVVLFYTRPWSSAATHWNAYDIYEKKWLGGNQGKMVTESITMPPGERLIIFKEARDVFFDEIFLGPFYMDIQEVGEYTWDASARTLNGQAVVSLQNASGKIRGIVKWQESPEFPSSPYRLDIEIVSATDSPGSYLIGETIRVKASGPEFDIRGTEITGTLYYNAGGWGWILTGLTFITYPDSFYRLMGTGSVGRKEIDGVSYISASYTFSAEIGGALIFRIYNIANPAIQIEIRPWRLRLWTDKFLIAPGEGLEVWFKPYAYTSQWPGYATAVAKGWRRTVLQLNTV